MATKIYSFDQIMSSFSAFILRQRVNANISKMVLMFIPSIAQKITYYSEKLKVVF